jgi:hypothetical protein
VSFFEVCCRYVPDLQDFSAGVARVLIDRLPGRETEFPPQYLGIFGNVAAMDEVCLGFEVG